MNVKRFFDKHMGFFLMSPTIAVMVLIIIVPLIIGLVMSFFNYNLLTLHRGIPFIGFSNYSKALGDENFWMAFWNTLWWTAANVAGQVALGLSIALLLNQPVKGVGIYKALILIPWAIPSAVAALSWMWLLHPEFGLVNDIAVRLGLVSEPVAWLGRPLTAQVWVVIARVWKEFPLSALIFHAALQTIPKDLYEAAEVDGAGVWKRFWNITIPYLKSSIVVAITLITIWTFNSFNMIWVMTKGGPGGATEILATSIYKTAFQRYNFEFASSQSILIVIFLSAIIIFYLYRVEGKKID